MHEGETQPSRVPVTALTGALLVAVCAADTHIGADARWLAAVGGLVSRAWHLPHDVAYAAVRSSGWNDAPVLGQLVFHALDATAGDRGLALAQLLAVALALGALAMEMRRQRARDGVAAAVLAAVVVGAPASFLVVRAELYSLAVFPLLLLLLRAEARQATRWIWLVVPLLALWANLHGGALVGFGVATLYLVLHRARRAPVESMLVVAAGAAALLATPALGGSVHYYLQVLHGQAAAQRYGLWAPLSPRQPLDLLFLAVAVPLVLCTIRARPPAWEAALVVSLALLTFDARRNGLWLLLAVAAPAARSFGAARPSVLTRRAAWLGLAAAGLVALAGLARPVQSDAAGPSLLHRAQQLAHGTPILADALDAETVALHGARILIGNPLEAFPARDQRLYLEWLRGAPAGDALTRQVRVVVVLRGTRAQERLARSARFREVARDTRAALYLASS